MHHPELAAPTMQPQLVALDTTFIPAPAAAQQWTVSVASAKYHWYDLLAGFPQIPDIRDPIGRYLRRMQFDLEAAAAKRLLYFVVTRPRVRFDTSRPVQWGFFSLKLTLPLLVGMAELREHLTFELKVPFAATMKKPTVTLTENFLTLNWGGLVEVLTIHDVLQHYDTAIKIPNKVLYVGQTWDPAARLAKGRLPEVQRLHHQNSEHHDTLILVQQMTVEAYSELGDPALWPAHQSDAGADELAADRSEAISAALMHYFEGPTPRRNHEEKCLRNARLREIQASQQIDEIRIDIELKDVGNYAYLVSDHAASAARHMLCCAIVEGDAQVTRCELPVTSGKPGKLGRRAMA
ncbi:MAG: hypothetical protein ACEQSK_05675 [Sphingomonadaceae bacterium]